MALGLVGRKSFIPFVACVAALAQGCFTTKGDDDSSSKGCTKDTDCASGRICNNGTCMNEDSSGGSGGSGAILSGGTSGSGATSSGSGGSKSSGGSSNATGGSSNATGGTSGSSSGGSSGMCSDTDPITCPTSNSMTLCINGTDQTLTCDYACTTLGFVTGPCSEPDGCACGDPTDQPCADGVNAFCSCISGSTQPCDQNDPSTDPLTFYIDCHQNDPSMQSDNDFLKCLGMQLPMGSTVSTSACQAAATACGAGTGGSSGTGGTGGTGGSAGASTGGSAGMPPSN